MKTHVLVSSPPVVVVAPNALRLWRLRNQLFRSVTVCTSCMRAHCEEFWPSGCMESEQERRRFCDKREGSRSRCKVHPEYFADFSIILSTRPGAVTSTRGCASTCFDNALRPFDPDDLANLRLDIAWANTHNSSDMPPVSFYVRSGGSKYTTTCALHTFAMITVHLLASCAQAFCIGIRQNAPPPPLLVMQ